MRRQWQWDDGQHHKSYNFHMEHGLLPVVLEEAKENEPRCRSPIQKVLREQPSKKNFGDYDPARYVPPLRFYTGVNGNLTEMQKQRKVIYAGLPPENEIKLRAITSIKTYYHDNMDTQMNQYGNDDDEDDLMIVEDANDNEKYQENESYDCDDQGNQAYQQQQLRPQQAEFSQRVSRDDYGNARKGNPNSSTTNNLGTYQQAPQHFQASSLTGGAGVRFPNLNLRTSQEQLKEFSGGGSRWNPGDSTGPGYQSDYSRRQQQPQRFENFGGEGEPYISEGVRVRADTKMSSTWTKYTKGTGGFFIPDQVTADNANSASGSGVSCTDTNRRSLNPEAAPFVYGYSTTEIGPSASASGNKLRGLWTGNHEIEFCAKIGQLNFFYSLKKLPNDEDHGTVYYGFELQFWPEDDYLSKEVVFGLRMADEAKAKDSTFAAGLEKLPYWADVLTGLPCKEREDQGNEGLKRNQAPSGPSIAAGLQTLSKRQAPTITPSLEPPSTAPGVQRGSSSHASDEKAGLSVLSSSTNRIYRVASRSEEPARKVNLAVAAPTAVGLNYERDREPIKLNDNDNGCIDSKTGQLKLTPSQKFFMESETVESQPRLESRVPPGFVSSYRPEPEVRRRPVMESETIEAQSTFNSRDRPAHVTRYRSESEASPRSAMESQSLHTPYSQQAHSTFDRPTHVVSSNRSESEEVRPRSAAARNNDENFRIAIPRDPCIILESQPRYRGQYGYRQGYNY